MDLWISKGHPYTFWLSVPSDNFDSEILHGLDGILFIFELPYCSLDSVCILRCLTNTCSVELIGSLFISVISGLSDTSQALEDRQPNGGKKSVLHLRKVRCVAVKCRSLVRSG